MSDTGKTILWIAVAIVVIAVIIWLFVSAGRRREVEARRFEAGELRARIEERLPQVQDTEDRASVTAALAADARAHAQRQNAAAERQADEARRQADRVDPDVDVDDDGDLADAETPSAPPVTASTAGGTLDEEPAEDAPGARALGTGTATELHPDERFTTVSDTPHADTSDASDTADTPPAVNADPAAGRTETAAAGGPSAQSARPPVATAEEPQQVEVPALADRDEVIAGGGPPASDPGDHRGQPWATTPGAAGPGDSEQPADEGMDVDMAPHSHASDETDEPDEAVATEPEPRREDAEPAPDLTSAAFPEDDATSEPQLAGRRTSGFDEVVDGGFGIGSAAPIADGAQPLGHAVKGIRDGKTFLGPDDAGYDDVEPDVWFYNEEAARRAGFRRQGD